ncbi:GerAB/ArcD/ProY family transporter [Gorillibacterium timonense]|uniref:GerAB/ArcD/ProY family transporter n=1 Tax=Gorillibacterium timonense TaxID=1689269 RepID=UPI00071E3FF5|nr:endospore germination permease [Gorillibacterium timonense]
MQKTAISQRQFAFLTISLLITTALINLPHFLIELSGSDAAFSVIIMAVYGLAIAAYLVMLSKRYPQKNLFEIHEIIFGRIGGTVINLFLLLHIWFVFMRDIRLFNFFSKVTLLPRTPTEILLLLFFIVLIYYGSTTIEVSARVNELLFPILLLSQLFLPILLINQFSFYSVDPYFVQPPSHVGLAGIVGCTWFGDMVVMGAFLQMLSSKMQMKAAFRFSVVTASFLICLFLTLSILVFGTNITAQQVYPSFSLAMQIFLTDFFDRLELPFLAIYFPIFFVNTTITFIAMMIGIGTVTKSRDYTLFNRSLGLLLLLSCILGFRGAIDVNVFSNYGFPFYVLIIEPLAICTVLIGYWIKETREKKRSRKSEVSDNSGLSMHEGVKDRTKDDSKARSSPEGTGGDSKEKDGTAGRPAWPQKKWTSVTNLFIGLAILFAAIGFLVGLDYQKVATGCAIGYHLCLLICIYTTYREAKRSRSEAAHT